MKFAEVQNKKILLSCLNWGMGHVSRSIGLVYKLKSQNNTIIVAGNDEQLKVFKVYFPEIQIIEMGGYPFEFKKYNSFNQAIWKQKWKLYRFLSYEKKWVNERVNEFSIDLVLSDHRYGFRSCKCTSIFITHQVYLPLRGFYKIFDFFHSYWLKQFNLVWIVDHSKERLAGRLSGNPNSKQFEYIGWLSRFQIKNLAEENQSKNFSVLLLSGPDLHLNYLYEFFCESASDQHDKIVIGSPTALACLPRIEHIKFINSEDWLLIDNILSNAHEIFSFFGYSTLMDSKFLPAKFHLVPCPGQWEQEYLSSIHPNVIIKH